MNRDAPRGKKGQEKLETAQFPLETDAQSSYSSSTAPTSQSRGTRKNRRV
jgi:hypothetical protein